jgi:hypothetical protein
MREYCILEAQSLHQAEISIKVSGHTVNAFFILLAVVLFPISLTIVYQHYSSIILQENYPGYQGNHNVVEYELAGWLSGKN